MRFSEVNLFGLYVAPIALVLVVAWIFFVGLRRAADRFGLLQYVWHPALFDLCIYVIVVSSIIFAAGWWGR
jgi:protein AaeX